MKWSVTVLVQILPGIVFAPIVLLLQRWLVALQGYLSWFRKNRKQRNLTAAVNINMPAGAGKKNPEPPNGTRFFK